MSLESFGHELRQAVEDSNKRRATYQRAAFGVATVCVFGAASAFLLTSARQSESQIVPAAEQPAFDSDDPNAEPPLEVKVPDSDPNPVPDSVPDSASDSITDSESSDPTPDSNSTPTPDSTSTSTPDADSTTTQKSAPSSEPAIESSVQKDQERSVPADSPDDQTTPATTTTVIESPPSSRISTTTTAKPKRDCKQADETLSVEAAAKKLGRKTESGPSGLEVSSVRILAFDLLGQPANVSVEKTGVGVSGGRYEFQIDYDASTASSERLRFEFPSEICSAVLHLNLLTVDGNSAESGRWLALNKNGKQVESGQFQTQPSIQAGSGLRSIAITLPSGVTALEIEATGYEQNSNATGQNNSDFSVKGITWGTQTD